MAHALLLSPDDQAVSAITGVLEEMAVTWERPLDGVSAAQKLNSQSFDLVLVDCENLPAAKLIFDVCRRGKNGNNPVPIAIVDGRAGLPTAFRLGAELILTKPVAKDQARSTIRTAVSRVKKDAPASANGSAASVFASEHKAGKIASTIEATTDGRDLAAEEAPAMGFADTSPQLTNFADVTPNLSSKAVAAASTSVEEGVTASAPSRTADKQASEYRAGVSLATTLGRLAAQPAPQLSARSGGGILKTAVIMKPSDDRVLAELERNESEADEKKNAKPFIAAPKVAAVDYPSIAHVQLKRKGALIGVLMLALAGGGFYAAWTYQPEFRSMAQPQIDRVLALVGTALPPVQAPAPAKPLSAPVWPVTAAQPASPSPSSEIAAASGSTGPQGAMSSPSPSAVANPAAGAASDGSAASPVSAALPVRAAPAPNELQSNKITAVRPGDKAAAESSKEGSTDSSEAEAPENANAVILSSKGAEKRLVHSVPAKYPLTGHSGGAQGTIVLKTLVNVEGKVASVKLVEGSPALAPAAMAAVKRWRYRPYVRDGKAQPFQTVVIVDFQRP
jgi:protein TonB